jgi:hypothetical protein
MGWQIRGGPACAKVVNPSKRAMVLIARREKACEFMFWIPPGLADLPYVSRDAERKRTVNNPVRLYPGKLEA